MRVASVWIIENHSENTLIFFPWCFDPTIQFSLWHQGLIFPYAIDSSFCCLYYKCRVKQPLPACLKTSIKHALFVKEHCSLFWGFPLFILATWFVHSFPTAKETQVSHTYFNHVLLNWNQIAETSADTPLSLPIQCLILKMVIWIPR